MATVSAEKGLAVTTIADIVREAGVSKRTFYEHFDGKEACFLALYRAVSASALVMDPERSALWLQTHLPQDAGVAALEACLERLANDIEFWRAML